MTIDVETASGVLSVPESVAADCIRAYLHDETTTPNQNLREMRAHARGLDPAELFALHQLAVEYLGGLHSCMHGRAWDVSKPDGRERCAWELVDTMLKVLA
jgi:hypothetical protein